MKRAEKEAGSVCVYRLRHRVTGMWYGKRSPRCADGSQWKKRAERIMSRASLLAVLRGMLSGNELAQIDVVEYRLVEAPASSSAGAFMAAAGL